MRAKISALARTKIQEFTFTVFVASTLTVILSLAAAKVEQLYLERYPHFCDEVGYSFQNVELSLKLKHRSRISLALDQCLTDDRHPFRTIPLILLAPNLLAKPFGYMATSVPLIFSFVTLLGFFVQEKTKSRVLSIAAMSLFCAIPGYIDTTLGLGAYWLDPTASMAFGSAALSLMKYGSSLKLSWLSLFMIFFSITAFSRYSAGFYLIFYSAPLLAYFLLKNYNHRYILVNKIIKPSIVLIFLGSAPLAFLAAHFQANANHYRTFAYGLNYPFLACLSCTARATEQFMGAVILTVLSGLYVWLTYESFASCSRSRIESFLTGTWCPTAVVIFLCCVVRSGDGVHPTVYIAPALFVAVFASASSFRCNWTKYGIASLLMLSSLFVARHTFLENCFIAKHPPQSLSKRKNADIAFASMLSAVKAKKYAEFDEENYSPMLEAFYRFNYYPEMVTLFTNHVSYWSPWYPGLSLTEIIDKVTERVNSEVDVVLVFKNALDVSRNPAIDNPISRDVARQISLRVQQDPSWSLLKSVDGPYGELLIYKKRKMGKTALFGR